MLRSVKLTSVLKGYRFSGALGERQDAIVREKIWFLVNAQLLVGKIAVAGWKA